MKLRSLIKLTEQAPVAPPLGGMGSPVAAPVAPPSAATPEQPPAAPAAPDTTPTPEDPSEYDWTKDFREFEDTKNKAEAEAKKKLLDKMNELLMSKSIVANASRGYGQPKTDYNIQNIKKISVEFWYKDYVVIVSDENDKKYFLTPGINIKIESGGGEEPQADGAPAPEGQPQPGAEEPNGAPGGTPPEGGPPTAAPGAADAPPAEEPAAPEPQAAQPAPQQAAPAQPAAPQAPAPQQPAPEQDPQQLQKKKKKMQEWTVQYDLSKFLNEYMADGVKSADGTVNFVKYIKGMSSLVTESADAKKVKFTLDIPVDHMVSPLDIREVKLSAVDTLRKVTKFGQYSKGSVEIEKIGRRYIMEYTKETGWIS